MKNSLKYLYSFYENFYFKRVERCIIYSGIFLQKCGSRSLQKSPVDVPIAQPSLSQYPYYLNNCKGVIYLFIF